MVTKLSCKVKLAVAQSDLFSFFLFENAFAKDRHSIHRSVAQPTENYHAKDGMIVHSQTRFKNY